MRTRKAVLSIRGTVAILCGTAVSSIVWLSATEMPSCPALEDASIARYFADEVWPKVGEAECLKCHKTNGEAEETRLVLADLRRLAEDERSDALRRNRDAFMALALAHTDQPPMLTTKATGGLDHGGGTVLENDSIGYRILDEFSRRANGAQPIRDLSIATESRSIFKNVQMLDDRRLLRRATLSLAGRLPTENELDTIAKGGLSALPRVLEAVMQEDAFFARLREAFNDIFLTQGIDGNPDQTVLSYEHFEKTRGWYQKHDLSHIADEKERRQAGYQLASDYRAALLDEPMRLIEYIVKHDRPFTEIVTADYIMVSPYTARGYGVFEKVREQFMDSEDPFEFVPIKLEALVGRNRSEDQESASGFYPHAGVLSTFQYLSRYPTTETNRNRLRARMYYQHFLGVDVLELAARGSDAAAVSAKYEIPTMQASECVVCHKTLDPVAGLFQDYWRFDTNFSIYGRRKDGWFTDMFSAGFEGENLPHEEQWRALQWLGEHTVGDPRFATAMVGHAYYMLTGRRPLEPPRDLDDPFYQAKLQAYRQQATEVDQIAKRFVDSRYNFKQACIGWILSDFYRADALTEKRLPPDQLAALDDLGVVRLLSPEQLERKIAAIFGEPWGRLNDQMALLYGGIDSQEVTDRAVDPSGAMGAIQRMMANDVACRHVAADFSRPPDRRILFPVIEPGDVPGISDEQDDRIRRAIVHLHERVLGRLDDVDSAEVTRTFALFAGIVADAKDRDDKEPQEIWHCRQELDRPLADPRYTIRAWRAVVTYLLRRQEFLYE